MSKKFLNSLAITLILIFSVGCGFLYDILFTQYRLKEYPRQYNDTVIACYYSYSVPVSVIYGTIKTQSDYESGLVNGDKIGLMQLTREEYDLLSSELGRRIDSGLLFDPKTNIEIGSYKLSKLFAKYQSWRAVYAALFIGEDTVDDWMRDEENLASDGTLENIPDEDTEKLVKKFEKTVDIYRELYESAN
jgi:hypothetical protein